MHDLVYIQNLHYFKRIWNWIISTNNCIYSGFENSFQTQIGITRDVKTMEHVSDNEYCLFLLHALTRKIKYWKIKDLIWYTSVIIYFYIVQIQFMGCSKFYFNFIEYFYISKVNTKSLNSKRFWFIQNFSFVCFMT